MDTNSNTELFEFIDKLFFNIYSYLPHETVANFLVQYSSLLYWRYSVHKPEWTIYPPNHEEFRFETVKHSIEFNTHPVFSDKIYKGYLEIRNAELTEIHNVEIEARNQTQDIKLILFFRDKTEGLKAIEIIDKGMSALGCRKREQTISGCLMVEYSSDSNEILNGLSYKFGKDMFENDYRLLIFPSANMIHFIK